MKSIIGIGLALFAGSALAHNVSQADIELITGKAGLQIGTYIWLGAKHMVTGYDHVLFLVGIVFYLKSVREVALFVSLFALGHSITLITGVLAGFDVNPYIVDAIIGFSVAYKGFDNLNGFNKWLGERPNEKLAVFIFGLFHGLGLATKLQDLVLSNRGLLGNLVSFNVGVELGQLAALVVIVLVLRRLPGLTAHSIGGTVVNTALIVAGFILIVYQMTLYLGYE